MARFGQLDTQYFDASGDPLSGGKIYFFESGTTTPKTTYADINNSIPNTHPVVLDAGGRQPNIFFDGVAKATLTDSNDVTIVTRDPVGETTTDFGDEWVSTRIYRANDVVIATDGQYYRALLSANQNNNPVSTSGYWTLLYSVEWNSGITYGLSAVVTYNNQQYQSLQASNTNHQPDAAVAWWVPLTFAWDSVTTYANGQNAIGTDGVLYTSQQASNINYDPTDAANRPTWWVGTSADAAASAAAAATSEANAATSESNAVTSETNAANSETAAAASETAAAASETAAAASETAAATSEANAATSESNASTSETNAAASASAAATSASNASTSETNALASETAASASETAAAASEANAATSESNAATSETNAAASASAAATSETNAATSESNASTSETNASNSASSASTSATNAATSATSASTSASNAATSASNASTSETNAANSATAAATSETNASASETNAAASETAAASSEANAATSESNAASSETNAASSASSASSSATSAASSATSAASSATSAASSASDAEAAWDTFDDVYLGAKSSDPSLDNDGNALTTGALYFQTTAGILRIFNGTTWQDAGSAVNGTANRVSYTATSGQTTFNLTYDVGFVDAYLNGVKLDNADFTAANGTSVILNSGASAGDIINLIGYGTFTVASGLLASNNLSDVSSVSSARTNLGLEIGTDVQAYDADTAKYDDVTANFTGTLQNGGSDVVVDTDIGSTVQAYDVDTAKYDDTTANFTGTLQNGGSNVVVDSDIGSTVQAYDATIVVDADIGSTVQAYDSNLTSFVGTFTLPTTDSTAGYVLKTDGAGTLSFVAQAVYNESAVAITGGSINGTTIGGTTPSTGQFSSLGVGTAASGTTGEIRATNNVTAYYSDERLKNFEGAIPNALDKVKALTGYYYTENETAKSLGYDNSNRQVGVSAQEVEAVLPEVVTEAPISSEYKTVYYEKLIPLLIEAIKELSAKVES